MSVDRLGRIVLSAVFAAACATPLFAQGQAWWRSWSTADGLHEAYTVGVAVAAGGHVWAKHGDFNTLTQLDGYTLAGKPDPGGLGRIYGTPQGELWMFDGRALRYFNGTKWEAYDLPQIRPWLPMDRDTDQQWRPHHDPDPLYKASLAPLPGGRTLFLLPEWLLLFDARRQTVDTLRLASSTRLGRFHDIRRQHDGRIWVTGQHGIAEIIEGAQLQWREHTAPVGLSGFENPYQAGKDLLLTASEAGGRVLVRFDGQRWERLYRGETARVRGWPGAAGEIWISDGNQFLRWFGNHTETIERTGVLEGNLLDAEPAAPGEFWLSTSQGIARYAAPLWSTPPGLRGRDLVSRVNACAESPDGTMWFLSPTHLIEFHEGEVHLHALPPGTETHKIVTETVRVLRDGRVAITLSNSPFALLFNRTNGRFTQLHHPEGRNFRMFAAAHDGQLLVQTVNPTDPADFRLETFDGTVGRVWLEVGPRQGISDLRAVLETASGDVWLGSTNGLLRLRHGEYRKWTAADGYADGDAFMVREIGGKLMAGGRNNFHVFDGKRWNVVESQLDRVRSFVGGPDGSVWVASGTGVHRWRPEGWITNSVEEGLSSLVAYVVYRDRHDRIWAGTARGISLFNPEADRDPPRTLIAEENNSHEISPGGQVRLVFSGIDKWKMTPAERLLFSYRLDGGEWTRFGEAHAITFRHLPGGGHRFDVRAMDRNGNADPGSAAFAFTVMVPWYQTTGFRFLAGVTAVVMLALAAWTLISYVKRGRLIGELVMARRLEEDRKNLLEMIARRQPVEELLQTVAESAHCCEGGSGALVLLLEGTVLRVAGSAGLDPAMARALDGREVPTGAGLAEKAARDGAVAFSADIAGDPAYAPVREMAIATGLLRVRATPLLSGTGDVLGVIELFHRRRMDPDEARGRFEMLARIAATGIENARLYDLMTQQARFDPLTRLPNRRYLGERLENMIAAARGSGSSFALLCIDLDRFKQINDSLGHAAGDEFLKHVAGRLAATLRPGDMLGRMGGDEFMVLLEQIGSAAGAQRVAERLTEALRSPVWIAGNELFPSASIGIGVFPEHGEDAATLQKNADAAMYRAKQRGRNRYECFSGEMRDEAGARLRVETQLRHGLEGGHFELWYQPQYTFAGELSGVEALVRLRDPERGLVSPSEFIPVAEDSGLILPLGEWVLREACRQRKAWEAAGCAPVRVGVNVSALQFEQRHFASMVASMLEEHGIAGEGIELELTEHTLMLNLEESVTQMQKLRALGVAMALDDFGTGYASLTQLHRLPLDVLKVDKRFVDEIDARAGTLPLVKSIVQLAHNLGLRVVAEGVERPNQHQLLAEIGCDIAQGFLLARPQPAAQVETVLRDAVAGLRQLSSAIAASQTSVSESSHRVIL